MSVVSRLAFLAKFLQLIFSRADLSKLLGAQFLQALTKSLGFLEKLEWDRIFLKLYQRHACKGALTFLFLALGSTHNKFD